MTISMLGIKVGMSQIFDSQGQAIPVTILQAGPCFVTHIKKAETDGYNAIQVGYYEVSSKKLNKPLLGHLQKSNLPPLKYLKEFSVQSTNDFSIGQKISLDQFKVSQVVDVSGISIGKGFTSLQKRHNFHRGPMTHGSKNHRAPGSIGAGTTPGRVFPGKKMSGRVGGKKVTIKNLQIINIKAEDNLLIIKGSVPGKNGNLLKISTCD
uniref:ribosomal protein L3 n=1 Tax=Glaucosphaera vacuolata TaxID=38265 RepID=UPI001FCCE43F|nr:ribosomal protein L3 [Glaucosphaera vacuolata]UNJ18738.1 ribosomal protein L3 [Glaucosphaera vacuolata]